MVLLQEACWRLESSCIYFFLPFCRHAVFQHYESLLAEGRSGKESSMTKAVEKAIFSKTHDLEYKLEKFAEEKKVVADVNFIFSTVKLFGFLRVYIIHLVYL